MENEIISTKVWEINGAEMIGYREVTRKEMAEQMENIEKKSDWITIW